MNERALRQLAHVPRLAIQASSSETARDTNRTIILELIRLAGAVSRADLARLSGLQKSTVSAIVEELLETPLDLRRRNRLQQTRAHAADAGSQQ